MTNGLLDYKGKNKHVPETNLHVFTEGTCSGNPNKEQGRGRQ